MAAELMNVIENAGETQGEKEKWERYFENEAVIFDGLRKNIKHQVMIQRGQAEAMIQPPMRKVFTPLPMRQIRYERKNEMKQIPMKQIPMKQMDILSAFRKAGT